MKVQRKGNIGKIALSSLTILVMFLMLLGCSGGDGAAGPAGAQGVQGVPGDPGAPGQNLLGQQGLADGHITAVTVPTPPAVEGTVVEFELLDADNGNLLSTLPADSVISFTYNKLGADGQWESYIIREGAITGTDNVGSAAGNKPAITAPVRQGTTQAGLSATVNKVVNLGGGKYSYTFTNTGLTTTNFTVPVTYAANATNRIGIQVAGGGAHYNTYKDFVPAGGPVTATRNIVTTAPCLECHQGGTFGFHHSGERNEVEYCVTCHNPASIDPNSGNSVDMANMVHKIHMGKELPSVVAGTPYIIWGNRGSVHDYSEVGYPQDVRNCTKCHAKVTEGTTVLNPDFEQWKKHPTRLACGACHDNVNFATGANHGLGGARADDTMCALCHDAVNIELNHVPVAPVNATVLATQVATGHVNASSIAPFPNNLPVGAAKITYDVSNVSVNASSQPVIKFKLKKNDADVVFNAFGGGKTEIMDGFVGSPSVYFAFALTQDGITAPADFNTSASGYIKRIWDGTATGTGAGTITGPDASGYYTITLTGVTVPATAKMLTGGLGYSYSLSGASATPPLVQTDVSGYPYDTTTKIGGLAVLAPNVWKVATGHTARRPIVTNDKCNKCHATLGVSPTFHAGQRNDAPTCGFCHTPNRTSSGWSANTKDFVHGIHAKSKRTVPFNWHALSATDGFWLVTYPAAVNSCEACHVPGTYDFSATASSSAASKLLYSTVGTGTYASASASAYMFSPYVAQDAPTYGSGFSVTQPAGTTTEAAATTLVISPITAACFACHDSTLAQAHMKANGGAIYEARATALAKIEQCLICHGPGKTAAIKAVHAKTAAE